ncbi:tetratricopeptide repeat protein [Paracidobacterium acidisoli]|nr:tetratricopeptide repeat protein [Paracidobacterium acidisoli]MBT9330357.1 tetratricopeptide repeat protein [Paracidobacterium acidisoli]
MRKTLTLLLSVAALACLCPAPRAFAVSKEMIQLQTQVQQLQDAVQHLQETQDQQLSVILHVIQQTTDNVNRMSTALNALQQQVQVQNESGGGKIDQVSTQMQGLNDSVDELKSRIAKLDTELKAIQSQLQNINTPPPAATPGSTEPGQPGAPAQGQPTDQQQGGQQNGQQPAPQGAMMMMQQQPQQPQAPPLEQLYQSAIRDYNGARYDLAGGEFSDVLKYYPQDDLAGNAQFYLGEISYRKGDYENAVKSYDAVLEQFAGNPKAPAAQLHKGEAELSLHRRDAGIRDLRNLIARYPQTPEASQARSRLNGMGVRIVAAKPSAYR